MARQRKRKDTRDELDLVWKALSDPTRRAILDLLWSGPRTTSEVVARFPGLTRFGVMKHLTVLHDAGLVQDLWERRQRINNLNVVPLRMLYERWVSGYQDLWAGKLTSLKRSLEDR